MLLYLGNCNLFVGCSPSNPLYNSAEKVCIPSFIWPDPIPRQVVPGHVRLQLVCVHRAHSYCIQWVCHGINEIISDSMDIRTVVLIGKYNYVRKKSTSCAKIMQNAVKTDLRCHMFLPAGTIFQSTSLLPFFPYFYLPNPYLSFGRLL